MIILAVDPGSCKSAYLVYDPRAPHSPCLSKGIVDNCVLRDMLLGDTDPHILGADVLIIEQMEHYGSGMPAGKSIFDTCIWMGRFLQAWRGPYALIPRREIKHHLCQSARANDGNIRQAILDMFGAEAIGTKKTPGPLYGVHRDMWSALAISITAVAHSAVTEDALCERCGYGKTWPIKH